ncbi:MAG TPA: organomercurial lyase [Allosphingosinicella sp.]|jgi:hypothetical protein
MALLAADLELRGALTRAIAELGHAPSNAALAARLGRPEEDVEASLRRLHEAHALLLHPHRCVPWVVHPFALSPGACWVETDRGGWWANCLYCAFGIAAALDSDAVVATRLGGEREAVEIRIAGGEVAGDGLLFHLSTPVRSWWDNVIHACATFQPFRSEAAIHAWCDRHALPKGAIVPLPAMWRFARDWYGDYLREPWRKRTREETLALFERHGFTGDFWSL